MTDGIFCGNCLSQYQEILSKARLFGTGKYSKLDRILHKVLINNGLHSFQYFFLDFKTQIELFSFFILF